MDLKASLKNKDFWIFDLDNTLYPSSNGLMSDVSDRMTKFVSMVTDKSVEEALIEQKELFKNHGTTLRGLMIRYSIDPWDFLRFVHNVNYNLVEKNQKLGNAIKALKGKKIIYTNASATHAKKDVHKNLSGLRGLLAKAKHLAKLAKDGGFPASSGGAHIT